MDVRSNWLETVLLAAIVSCLLAVIVLGINVPGNSILRPIIGFVLLTVVPGYLLVSLLGLDSRPPGRVIIYSVGLSLPVVVCLSIVVNAARPAFAIDRPLSPLSLTAAVSVFVLGLSAVRFVGFRPARSLLQRRDGRSGIHEWEFGSATRSSLQEVSLSGRDGLALASVSLLPICSALVTVFTDTAGFDWLLIALLCALSAVPLVLWRWQGSPALYPYAVWVVAASVLLQMTLVSGHLWGHDIHYEYRTAAEIFQTGYWNPALQDSSNSLVTVTLLAAVYSMVTGLDIVWVYKLIYPLLVSLLPVGIWYIARSEFSKRSVAMLAPFALMFYYGFFKDMPDKQLVAGLFAVFMLVAFLDRELSTIQRWVLGLTFAVGLVFSHYGVSLLFAAFLAFALVARYIVQTVSNVEVTARIARLPLVAFLGLFWVVWYLFTASGVNFYRVVGVGYEMAQSLPFPTSERSGAAYATMGFESGYWLAYKSLYILLVGLVGLGVVSVLYTAVIDRDTAQSTEYALFAAGVLGFLASSVVFTFGMGFDRTLQIALFVLSPFAIVGAMAIVSLASWFAARVPESGLRARIDAIPTEGLFAVFLAVLFLFSSGTIFALAGQPLPAYNINLDEDAGWPVYSQSEVNATRWLAANDIADNGGVAVYNDWEQIKSRDGLLVSEVVPAGEIEPIWLSKTSLNDSAYVYVSHKPMTKLNSDTEYIDIRKTPFYQEVLVGAETVYTDDNVSIYYAPPNNSTTHRNARTFETSSPTISTRIRSTRATTATA
jgi:uncharacterized membrane protein